jgi:hypothetical protein
MTDFCLLLEYADTVDMPDGQPLPPIREYGAVWNVVRRRCGRTLWRRLRLVASATLTTSPPREASPRRNHPDWHATQQFCLRHIRLLRPREEEFVASLSEWQGDLTAKQNAWLMAIYKRVRCTGG